MFSRDHAHVGYEQMHNIMQPKVGKMESMQVNRR